MRFHPSARHSTHDRDARMLWTVGSVLSLTSSLMALGKWYSAGCTRYGSSVPHSGKAGEFTVSSFMRSDSAGKVTGVGLANAAGMEGMEVGSTARGAHSSSSSSAPCGTISPQIQPINR
eukprot:6993987-Pyramimonas_sp.AAC.1